MTISYTTHNVLMYWNRSSSNNSCLFSGGYDEIVRFSWRSCDHERNEASKFGSITGCVYKRAAILHSYWIHVSRKPFGLPKKLEQNRSNWSSSYVHGNSNCGSNELPRVQKLHSQVRLKFRYFFWNKWVKCPIS